MNERVKVEGDRFHGHVPADAMYVGREFPGHQRSPYANPHAIGPKGCRTCGGRTHDRGEAIELYRVHLRAHPELVDQARSDLAGRDLACWCKPTEACHADVLLAVVAGEDP